MTAANLVMPWLALAGALAVILVSGVGCIALTTRQALAGTSITSLRKE